jgi:NAD(P)-dependent dehydrogenase (short-subunit alcohol dehydrogenase family)
VRKEVDAEKLRALDEPLLIPICPLDLTRLEDIPVVVKKVNAELDQRGIGGLYALINNAGGGLIAPIELLDLDQFRLELQARVVGSVASVQAFLPLIRKAGGRIIWIMTPAAIPTPYVASIHACDFAVNCVARTLDIELQRWGIRNIQIRCGGIRTGTGMRTVVQIEEGLRLWPTELSSLYAKELGRWGKDMAKFDTRRTEPEKVAQLISNVLSAKRPRRRYFIGHMARVAALLESVPQPITDAILRPRF